MSQPKHSIIGASSSERWFNCAGSVRLSRLAPKQTSSYSADEGTAAHSLAERCFNEGSNAVDYVNETIGEFTIDHEMASAVDVYVNYVRSRHAEDGGVLKIEERFDLTSLYPGLYGTNDACIIRRGKRLIVIDFKYGYSPVEAQNNKQLLFYGVGAATTCDFDFTEIELVIVQPRAPHINGPIRSWTVNKKYLVEWSFVLVQAAKLTEQENAPLNRGEWCEYCPAKGLCPKMNDAMEESVGMTITSAGPVAIESLTDQQVVRIIENEKLITEFIKEVKSAALHRIKNGEKISGLKLVAGKGRREWNDEKEIEARFKDEAFEKSLISVKTAEDKFGKKSIEGLFRTIPGSDTVAHVSDRRKEIQNINEKLILNKKGDKNA